MTNSIQVLDSRRRQINIPVAQFTRNQVSANHWNLLNIQIDTLPSSSMQDLNATNTCSPGRPRFTDETTLNSNLFEAQRSTLNIQIPVVTSGPHLTRQRNARNNNNLRSLTRSDGNIVQDHHFIGLNFCLLNAQSLNNKAGEFIHLICEYKPDVVALTETCFPRMNQPREHFVHLLATNFSTFHEPVELVEELEYCSGTIER